MGSDSKRGGRGKPLSMLTKGGALVQDDHTASVMPGQGPVSLGASPSRLLASFPTVPPVGVSPSPVALVPLERPAGPLAIKGSFSAALDPSSFVLSDMEEWDIHDRARAKKQEPRWISYRAQFWARQLLRAYRDDQLRAEGIDPRLVAGAGRRDHQMARCRWVRWASDGYHVTYSPERQRGSIQGWVTCKSWLCPVCGAILAQARAAELGKLVAVVRARGCVVALGRVSDSHKAGDEQTIDELVAVLRDQVKKLRHDYHEVKRNRSWRRLDARFGVEVYAPGGEVGWRIYSVGSLENTYGYNGYHPHEQPLFIFRPGADVAAFEFELRNLYYSVRGGAWSADPATGELVPVDRNAWENGCSVTSNDGAVNEYITKMGRPPRWDVAQEVVMASRKRGRIGKSKHYAMMELLWSYILTGNKKHGRLYTAFVLAMKGKHQLDWSPGLRAYAGLGKEQTEAEVIDEAEDAKIELALVDDLTMYRVLWQDRRADLCAVADTGDPERVRAYLARVRSAAGLAAGLLDGDSEGVG